MTDTGEGLRLLKAVVRNVLQKPQGYDWTVQGLGMLRCHPWGTPDFRLNVWHRDFLRTGVSDVHDHPWHFTSWIVTGRMFNCRWIEKPMGTVGALPYLMKTVNCGEDYGDGVVTTTFLQPVTPENYFEGMRYSQEADEIHFTNFDNGTITINHRQRVKGQAARIFWPAGEKWVDAAPRDASLAEIVHGCEIGLAKLDNGGSL